MRFHHLTLPAALTALTLATSAYANGFHIVTRYMRLHETDICEGEDCHPSTYEIERTIGAVPSNRYDCGGFMDEHNYGTQPYDDAPDFDHHEYRGICELDGGWMVSYVKDGGQSLEVWESGGGNRFMGKCYRQADYPDVECGCGAGCGGPAEIKDFWVCPFMC